MDAKIIKLVEELMGSAPLTPDEKLEAMRVAHGVGVHQAAEILGGSFETYRTRRKKMYKKLGVSGDKDLLVRLLFKAAGVKWKKELGLTVNGGPRPSSK